MNNFFAIPICLNFFVFLAWASDNVTDFSVGQPKNNRYRMRTRSRIMFSLSAGRPYEIRHIQFAPRETTVQTLLPQEIGFETRHIVGPN